MEAVNLGWEAFAMSWLDRCNKIWAEENKGTLMEMLRWIIPDCLTFVQRHCKQLLKPGEINIVLTTLHIFEMLLNDACDENSEDFSKFLSSWFQAAITFSVVWGIGGILDIDSRAKFDEFYREVCFN